MLPFVIIKTFAVGLYPEIINKNSRLFCVFSLTSNSFNHVRVCVELYTVEGHPEHRKQNKLLFFSFFETVTPLEENMP